MAKKELRRLAARTCPKAIYNFICDKYFLVDYPMKNFYQIMEELLEFDGYELLFGGHGKLVGKKGEDFRSIIIAGEDVTKRDITDLDDSEGEKILVIFGDVTDELKELLPDVEIWDREDLIHKFGVMVFEKSIIEGVLEGDPAGSDLDFDVKYYGKESTLKPIMDFEDVKNLSEKMVNAFRYRLELVPYYRFKYQVFDEEGEMYMNAISGRNYFWNRSFKRVKEIKRSHFKLEPKISKEKAYKKALQKLREKYSTTHTEEWEENGATIVEKKKIIPEKEDMELMSPEIVFVPIWAVEGTDGGIVIINSATGKIEHEPDHEDSILRSTWEE
ncbi:MAG: hypothetical protein R6U17_04955 [Thermoplasmata archaeon]